MKTQETLEEFINSQPYYGSCTTEYLEGIEEGAKWQQEQIYNLIKQLYDNEEITGFTKRAYAQCLDIIEQFKNK